MTRVGYARPVPELHNSPLNRRSHLASAPLGPSWRKISDGRYPNLVPKARNFEGRKRAVIKAHALNRNGNDMRSPGAILREGT